MSCTCHLLVLMCVCFVFYLALSRLMMIIIALWPEDDKCLYVVRSLLYRRLNASDQLYNVQLALSKVNHRNMRHSQPNECLCLCSRCCLWDDEVCCSVPSPSISLLCFLPPRSLAHWQIWQQATALFRIGYYWRAQAAAAAAAMLWDEGLIECLSLASSLYSISTFS